MNLKFDDYFKRCYDIKVIGHDRAFVSFLAKVKPCGVL